LSEHGYGVAILSESKYGFSADGIMMRISLLRAATSPDAEQDQGEHSFSWAVYPHVGGLGEADVPGVARIFNYPMHVRYVHDETATQAALQEEELFTVEGAKGVILDTVKRGEDDDFVTSSKKLKTIILRLYESYGGHSKAKLRIAGKVSVVKGWSTNILEDELEPLKLHSKDGSTYVDLQFRGFQFVTVKLALGSSEHAGSREP